MMIKRQAMVLCVVAGLSCSGAMAAQALKALRDPTQPPGMEYKLQTYGQDIKIQAIYYNATQPVVIIDGKTYGLGDTLSGAVITKISADSVTLQGSGGDVVLSMYPTVRQPIKKTKDKKTN